MAAIKVQSSRFALLKIEDDDSDDGQKKESQAKKGGSQSNAQKKKNKKKKQLQQNQEKNELQHLAFGLPNRSHSHSQSGQETHHPVNGGNVSAKQWDEWQKQDEEYAADNFEKDLQQALLLSKLENEQSKQREKSSLSNGQRGDGDGKDGGKKKKKKDKPATMSLEQFNKQSEEKKTHADELDIPSSPAVKTPVSSTDTKFFEGVESDVSRIIRQEKMQEEYKKQYAAESVITAKYQDQIKKLEKEVEFLRATMKKQEEELKQVKKRNKQLCVILAQGEMKDKAEVLMQVDQLSGVKDELTEQVSELTAELEKERSKVHSLKAELDKLKGSRHK